MADVVSELSVLVSAHGVDQVDAAMKKLKGSQRNAANESQKVAGKMSKMNQVAGQLSFGLQDMLVTFQTMGAGGALRAASNNFAQIGAIFGGLSGAAAGLGVTALSMIPSFLDMGSAGKKAGEEISDAMKRAAQDSEDALARIKVAIEGVDEARKRERAVQGVRGAGANERVKKVFEGIDKADRDIEDITSKIGKLQRARRDFVAGEGGITTENMLREADLRRLAATVGRDAAIRSLEANEFSGVQNPDDRRFQAEQRLREIHRDGFGIRRTDRRGAVGSPFNSKEQEKIFNKTFDDMTKQMDKLNQELENTLKRRAAFRGEEVAAVQNKRDADARKKLTDDTKRSIKAAQEKKKADDRFSKDFERGAEQARREVERARKETEKSEQRAARDEKRMKEKQNRDAIRRTNDFGKAMRNLESTLDPAAGKVRKVTDRFNDIDRQIIGNSAGGIFGGAAVAGPLSVSARARKQALEAARKPQASGISGTFGVSDFSRQLQNALLKSDTQKAIKMNTGKTAAGVKAIGNKIDQTNKRLEELNMGFGP